MWKTNTIWSIPHAINKAFHSSWIKNLNVKRKTLKLCHSHLPAFSQVNYLLFPHSPLSLLKAWGAHRFLAWSQDTSASSVSPQLFLHLCEEFPVPHSFCLMTSQATLSHWLCLTNINSKKKKIRDYLCSIMIKLRTPVHQRWSWREGKWAKHWENISVKCSQQIIDIKYLISHTNQWEKCKTPIAKWHKIHKQVFPNVDTRKLKRCSLSLEIRVVHIKTSVRDTLYPFDWQNLSNSQVDRLADTLLVRVHIWKTMWYPSNCTQIKLPGISCFIFPWG